MTRYWNDSLYLQEDELAHHGVLGMHWGVRRYQNKDGSLTNAGKKKMKRATVVDDASGHHWNQTSDKSKKLADKAAETKWSNTSTAKKLGALVVNNINTPAYTMQRARGEGKIKSWLKANINIGSIAGSMVGAAGGQAISYMLGGDQLAGSAIGAIGGAVGSYVRSRSSYIKDREQLNNK